MAARKFDLIPSGNIPQLLIPQIDYNYANYSGSLDVAVEISMRIQFGSRPVDGANFLNTAWMFVVSLAHRPTPE